MFGRQVNILKSNSFFLFGARGTGKTSLLGEIFNPEDVLWIDLLEGQNELQFAEDPDRLSSLIAKSKKNWVVIDEVQKVPKLLDIAHLEIEKNKIKFALTGSSARKLKRGGANLLAGRAFVYNLFPFSHSELGEQFDLDKALQWGTLPRLFEFSEDEERKLFLSNYVETYLKEEIFAEQLVRGVIPFRKFLKLAAQSNGAVLNYKRIANDIGVDSKTVQNYFDIVEDTLLGFYLPATSASFRKQQIESPKFYLFDCGVKREIENTSHLPIATSQELGVVFEHWLITEIFKLNSYKRKKYELSYLLTKGGVEIDLVLTEPRTPPVFVEIKSTKTIQDSHIKSLIAVKDKFPESRCLLLCCERYPISRQGVDIFPWREGLEELGLTL